MQSLATAASPRGPAASMALKTASSAIDAPRCENGLTVSTAVSPVVPRTGGREGKWIHAMATNSLLQQMDGVMMVELISYVVCARALGV